MAQLTLWHIKKLPEEEWHGAVHFQADNMSKADTQKNNLRKKVVAAAAAKGEGVQIQLPYSTRHPDRKWTPEDLHLAVHSNSLGQVTAGEPHVSPQINSLFCMDDLQGAEPARKTQPESNNHAAVSLPVDQEGIQGLHRRWQSHYLANSD